MLCEQIAKCAVGLSTGMVQHKALHAGAEPVSKEMLGGQSQCSHLEEWMSQGLSGSWSPSRVPLTQGGHETDCLNRGVGDELCKGGGRKLRKAPPQLPCSVQSLWPTVRGRASQYRTHLVHLVNLQAPCKVIQTDQMAASVMGWT